MSIRKKISTILALVFWLLLGSGVLVLLVAAVNIKNRQTCKSVSIEITGVEEFLFLDKEDIHHTIREQELSNPEGKPVASFNLLQLETALEKNVWVRDAELFFDNNMVLHVHIAEREPVARIFTLSGRTYYIDSSAHIMPVTDKMNIRIPVFTGFPSESVALKGRNLKLMKEVRDVAVYISGHPFFKAQIAQVDINSSHSFEMVPVVGNHVIVFGNGQQVPSKFRKLLLFYQQVVGQSGFDMYSRIDVQYDKQVIGTRRGFAAKIDSVAVIKNVERLIEESKMRITDSVFTFVDKNLSSLKKPDSTLTVNETPSPQLHDSLKPVLRQPFSPNIKTVAEKREVSTRRNPVKKAKVNPSVTNDKPKPKAVMPKLQ